MADESKAPQSPGSSNRWLATAIATVVTLGAAMLLLHSNDKYSAAASAALLADSSLPEDAHAG